MKPLEDINKDSHDNENGPDMEMISTVLSNIIDDLSSNTKRFSAKEIEERLENGAKIQLGQKLEKNKIK
jgi:hypothetical protein